MVGWGRAVFKMYLEVCQNILKLEIQVKEDEILRCSQLKISKNMEHVNKAHYETKWAY